MNTRWISSLQERPRCRVTDGEGLRCREPVLWDEGTNRPLSTRCQAHGGLADATLMGRLSREMTDPLEGISSVSSTVSVLAKSAKKLPTMDLRRALGGLPALVLAGALCLFLATPALADFESAVAAYERGDYQEAQSEFEALAADGDRRAVIYLGRIRDKRRDNSQAGGSVTSDLMESISSIFSGSEASSDESGSGAASGNTRTSETAKPGKEASDQKSADWRPWSSSEGNPRAEAPPPPPQSDVVIPPRKSIWSAIPAPSVS